jgi:hypothetical protein
MGLLAMLFWAVFVEKCVFLGTCTAYGFVWIQDTCLVESRWPNPLLQVSMALNIDGHLALTRWASPGTARKSTVQARPGPISIVPVPGTARL